MPWSCLQQHLRREVQEQTDCDGCPAFLPGGEIETVYQDRAGNNKHHSHHSLDMGKDPCKLQFLLSLELCHTKAFRVLVVSLKAG